jgi:type IV pilus assembly protein PilV
MQQLSRKHLAPTGASMPEILITVLIVSFGLLALASMQTYAVAINKLAGNRSMAAIMANDLIEILHANKNGYHPTGSYDRLVNFSRTDDDRTVTAFATPACVATRNCAPDVLAAHDMNMFRARLKAALPYGDYRLQRDANIPAQWADIWILWAEQITTRNQANAVEDATDRINDNCPADMQVAADANSPLRGLRCFYMRIPL